MLPIFAFFVFVLAESKIDAMCEFFSLKKLLRLEASLIVFLNETVLISNYIKKCLSIYEDSFSRRQLEMLWTLG